MLRSGKDHGTVEMIIAMILSGTIGYFVINSGQSFWNVVFFRCLIGSLCLGVYVAWRFPSEFKRWNKAVIISVLCGGIALVGNWVLLFASFNYIPFSIATIAYHMQPIMLVIAGALLAKQLPGANIVFWLMIALLGLWLIVEIDTEQIVALFSSDNREMNGGLFGLMLALGAAVLYTVATLSIKHVSHIEPSAIALVQVGLGVFLLLPLADFSQLPESNQAWVDILFLGVVNTAFMYIIMYNAFQKLSTQLIALLSFIYPITALVVDYVAFDHRVDLWQLAGVVLILTSVSAVKFNWQISGLFSKSSQLKKEA